MSIQTAATKVTDMVIWGFDFRHFTHIE